MTKTTAFVLALETNRKSNKLCALYEFDVEPVVVRAIKNCQKAFKSTVYAVVKNTDALTEIKGLDVKVVTLDELNGILNVLEGDAVFVDANAPFLESGLLKEMVNRLKDGNENKGICLKCGQNNHSTAYAVSKNAFKPTLLSSNVLNETLSCSDLIERLNLKNGFLSVDDEYVLSKAEDPFNLLYLSGISKDREISKHMNNGVEFVSKEGILIAQGVKIGGGTRILPGTVLAGDTIIGADCVVGPNSYLHNAKIGDRSTVNASYVLNSVVKNDVKIGPFCQIRPGCVIDYKVKIGDFVEVKNSNIGAGTAVSHLTYIGDSDVGKNVNFGCGVVTVNYDGVNKNRCSIGDGAFIGCNTNLIAPVEIGKNAYTAAGSTITKEVKEDELAIARTRQKNIEGFSKSKLKGRKLKVND